MATRITPYRSDEVPPYKYQQINNFDSYIRVIDLRPSIRLEDELTCSFRLVKCVGLFGTLDYEALSYTWGSSDTVDFIRIVDGQQVLGRLPVARNLDQALRHLRHRRKCRSLWVDALCINQSDDEEKRSQILHMSWIYRLASRTVIWLGTGSSDVEEGLKWAARVGRGWSHNKLSLGRMHRAYVEKMMMRSGGSRSSKAQDLFYPLIHNPYFERAWTVQEGSLSRAKIVVVGNQSVRWVDFGNGLVWIIETLMGFQRPIRGGQFFTFASASNRPFPQYDPSAICLESVVLTRGKRCLDPRDKIFSLSSMIYSQGGGYTSFPIPDYTMTIARLCVNTTVSILQEVSLNVILFIHPDDDVADLPSWVPDWTATRESELVLPVTILAERKTICRVWSNSTYRSPSYRLSHLDFRLHVRGIRLDAISLRATMSPQEYKDDIPDDTPSADELRTLRRRAHEVETFQEWIWLAASAYRRRSLPHFVHALFAALYSLERVPQDAYVGNFECFQSWHATLAFLDRSRHAAPRRDWLLKELLERAGDTDVVGDLNDLTGRLGHVIAPDDARMTNPRWRDLVEQHPAYIIAREFYGRDPSRLPLTFHQRLLIRSSGLVFVCTELGLMGCASRRVQPNDEVVLFYGMDEPVIVRPVGGGQYLMVSPVHLPGMGAIAERISETAELREYVLV